MGNTVDREIRITASDTGVADRLSKLKEGALALGRGIAEDAKKQATSSRELIKLMNEEISAIEKRNKLNKEQRELEARQKPGNTGVMGKTQLAKDLQKISIESKEDKLQTDLLKQILDATLKTSTAEITANRDAVKSKISSDKEIDTMEDHEQALKQTFQKQMLKDTEPDDGDGKSNKTTSVISSMGRFTQPGDLYSMGLNSSSGYMHKKAARQENDLARNALLAGGIALGGAGMSIQAGSDYYGALDEIAELTGNAHPTQYDDVHKGTDLTRAQAIKRAAALMKSSGGTVTDPTEMNRVAALEQGFGINGETLGRTRRFGDATAVEAMGAARMVMTDKDTVLHRARTEELLELQLEMTEKQFMATGEGSTFKNMAIIQQIMSGQTVKDVGRAKQTIGKLDAMASGGSEELRALKLSEFQKNGGGSYWDFLKEEERGASGQLDDLMISRVLNSDQSDFEKKMSLKYMGDFTTTEVEEIMRTGSVSPTNEGKYRRGAGRVGELSAQETITGGVGVNPVAESSAMVTNALALLGEATVETTKTILSLGEAAGKEAVIKAFSSLGKSNSTTNLKNPATVIMSGSK